MGYVVKFSLDFQVEITQDEIDKAKKNTDIIGNCGTRIFNYEVLPRSPDLEIARVLALLDWYNIKDQIDEPFSYPPKLKLKNKKKIDLTMGTIIKKPINILEEINAIQNSSKVTI